MSVVSVLLESSIGTAIGWTLVHFCWQGGLIAMFVWLLLRCTPADRAPIRYWIACSGLCVMAASFVATFCFVLGQTPSSPQNNIAKIGLQAPVLTVSSEWEQPAAMTAGDISVVPTLETPSILAQRASKTNLEFVSENLSLVLPWFASAWILGVVVLSARMLFSWKCVQRLRYTHVTLVNDHRFQQMQKIAKSLKIRRVVQLAESEMVEVPMVIGWLRPIILLPVAAVTGLSESQLTAILAHELAHVRRSDYIVNLIQSVMETVLFFHPCVWWLSAEIREQREHCCDDLATNWCGDVKDYAGALIQMEQLRSAHGLALSAGGGSLTQRITRLLSNNQAADSKRSRVFSLAAVVSFAMVLTMIAVPVLQRQEPQYSLADEPDEAFEKDQPAENGELGGMPETVVNAVPEDTLTAAITLSGRALDRKGKPIAGAKIFIASHGAFHKLLKTTTTDEQGRYAFRDLRLPLSDGAKNVFTAPGDIHSGRFELYGTADGYAFTWRPSKSFHTKVRQNMMVRPGPDDPASFEQDPNIRLDLIFRRPAPLGGKVVDENGGAIPNTKVQIWSCWGVPNEKFSDSDMFQVSMQSIYSQNYCPKSISTVVTNDKGEFRFPHVPPETRFQLMFRPPGFTGRSEVATTESDASAMREGKAMKRDNMRVAFMSPREIEIQMNGFTKPENRKDMSIGPFAKFGSAKGFTDENGLAKCKLPPGKYKVSILPATGSPYMNDNQQSILVTNKPKQRFELKMTPAAVVKVQVIDDGSGEGLKGFDFWVENEYPREDGTIHRQRDLHMYRSFERKTRIAHVHRKQTDEHGRMVANFLPGKRRIGIGLNNRPKGGWVLVNPGGQNLDLKAGETTVTFQVRRRK